MLQLLVAGSTRMYSQEAYVHVYTLYVCIRSAIQKTQHSHKHKLHQWCHPFPSLADSNESLFVENTYIYNMDPSIKWPFRLLTLLSSWSLVPLVSQLPHRPTLRQLVWIYNLTDGQTPGVLVPPVAKSQTFWSLQYLAQTHSCSSSWLPSLLAG